MKSYWYLLILGIFSCALCKRFPSLRVIRPPNLLSRITELKVLMSRMKMCIVLVAFLATLVLLVPRTGKNRLFDKDVAVLKSQFVVVKDVAAPIARAHFASR